MQYAGIEEFSDDGTPTNINAIDDTPFTTPTFNQIQLPKLVVEELRDIIGDVRTSKYDKTLLTHHDVHEPISPLNKTIKVIPNFFSSPPPDLEILSKEIYNAIKFNNIDIIVNEYKSGHLAVGTVLTNVFNY
jgi:hypothetical protein